jgi:hypothetical protein
MALGVIELLVCITGKVPVGEAGGTVSMMFLLTFITTIVTGLSIFLISKKLAG